MERDFLGIGRRDLAAVDSGCLRNSSVPWSSFSGMMSSMPQQFANSSRIFLDPISYPGCHPMPPAKINDLETNIRLWQKNWSSNYFQLPGCYHPAPSADPLHPMATSWAGRCKASAPPKQQPPSSVPRSAPPEWRDEEQDRGKPAGATSQLTIFYAGTVNVYDEIPPDRAEAIMLMVANELREVADESISLTLAPSCSAFSIPTSTTSHVGDQSEEAQPLMDRHDAPPASSASNTPLAIPQARKVSLARFLEKRKERMAGAAPYSSS